MCYNVCLSTDSPDDLADRNSALVRFEQLPDSDSDPTTALLAYPRKWRVGSRSGCGCSFRHLMSIDLGFSDPVDWYPEEQDAVAATRELYSTLAGILSSGYHIDLIDSWQGASPEDIKTLEVALDGITMTSFRLFENHKFNLIPTGRSHK